MNDLAKLLQAASFAAKKHRYQKRKGDDAEPYVNHPLEVANLLANIGKVDDYDILIAAVLHDTIEDTETTKEELTELFGAKVSDYVMEVTDDKSLPKVGRNMFVGGVTAEAHYRCLVRVTIPKFGRAGPPERIVKLSVSPRDALVGTVVEVPPC